ncbi:MAG: right-handed parallel beta-helix repeat-containing protein [Elusimicrobia bacterium]|nr:right-handed parallel beta-helix repeat-containing protein [Elusimicrobiota bacterium]
MAVAGPSGLVTFTQSGQVSISATNGTVSSTATFMVAQFNPVPLGQISISGVTNVKAGGNFAYATTGTGLTVVDATNPQIPTIAGSVSLGGTAAVDLAVRGTLVYVANGTNVNVVDVSTPSSPHSVATLSTGGSVQAVALSADLSKLYIGDNLGLKVASLANPSSPSIIGSVAFTGTMKAIAVGGIESSLAFVSRGTQVSIVDVTIPATPVLKGSVSLTAEGITAIGNFAFVASQSAGVQSIDATDPMNPRVVGATNISQIAFGVVAKGSLVLTASPGFANSLPIFNESDPTNPTYVARLDFPGTVRPNRIDATDSLVYESGNGVLEIGLYAPQFPATPPSVSLLSPVPGFNAIEGGPVAVTASASDAIGVSQVVYSVNGTAQTTASAPPYAATVRIPSGTSGQQVQISAQAQNLSGVFSSPSSVMVNVTPDPLTTVQGRLVTVFGDPIPNAPITLVDGLQTTSAPDGSFFVSHVPTAPGIELLSSTATVSGFTLFANVRRNPVFGGLTDFGDVVLNGNITLSGSVSGTLVPILSPYKLTGAATINTGQTLNLPAGTIVKFAPGASLTVNGALVTTGTVTSPVTFTSLADDSIGGDTGGDGPTLGAAGQHVGVIFTNANAATNLTYTTLEYAQSIQVTAGKATFNNALFTNMSVAAVRLSPGAMVAGQGNQATSNPVNGLDLIAGDANSINTVWNNIGLPFVVRGNDVSWSHNSTLTINPGAIVKLKGSVTQTAQLTMSALWIRALGTPNQSVIFTSLLDDSVGGDTNGDGSATSPAAGDWLDVVIGGTQPNVFNNTIFRYGGNALATAMVNGTSAAPLIMSNVVITSAAAKGLYSNGELDMSSSAVTYCGSPQALLIDTASSATLSNVLFDSNRSDAVLMQGASQASFSSVTWSNNAGIALFVNNSTGTLIISTATFLNNPGDAIKVNPALAFWSVKGAISITNSGVAGFDLLSNSNLGGFVRTWPALPIPYVIRAGGINLRQNLIIAAGAIIKLLSTPSIISQITGQEGAIIVQGTPSQPVVFTSLKDDSYGGDTNADDGATSPAPGDWTSLSLSGNTPNSLDNVIFRYGGAAGNAMVSVVGPSTITNFDISSSAAQGLYTQTTLTLSNGILAANAGTAGVDLFTGSSSTLTNVQFLSNNSDGLKLEGNATSRIYNSTYTGNAGYGIFATNTNVGTLTMATATFVNNAGVIKFDPSVAALNISGPVTIANSGIAGVDILSNANVGGAVRTWSNIGMPYVIRNGGVNFRSNLTLQPGVIVKLLSTPSIISQITGQEGAIIAQGTQNQPVVFTSLKDDSFGGDTNVDDGATSPAPGDWTNLSLSGNTPNSLDNVVFRYGGAAGNAMVSVVGPSTITNFDISSSAAQGLYTQTTLTLSTGVIMSNRGTMGVDLFTGANAALTNIQFNGNSANGLELDGSALSTVTNSTFTGNGTNGLFASNTAGTLNVGSATFVNNGDGFLWNPAAILNFLGPISLINSGINGIDVQTNSNVGGVVRTWSNPGVPYVIRGGPVNFRQNVTVQPGTVIKLRGTTSSFTGQEGTITAQGTSAQPIVFTSLKDDGFGGDTNLDGAASSPARGDWGALGLGGNGNTNLWSHVVVRYGGANGSYMLSGGNLTASNCDVSFSAADGFQLGSGTTITITSTTFTNNVVGYRSVFPLAGASIGQSIFSGNSSFGVTTSGGSAANVINNYWGSPSGPTVSTNPGGTGDAVSSTNVTYSPFLTSPPAGAGP